MGEIQSMSNLNEIFMFQEGLTAAETQRQLCKVMSSNALSKTTIQVWFRKFKNSQWDVKEHRGGRCHNSAVVDIEEMSKSNFWKELLMVRDHGQPNISISQLNNKNAIQTQRKCKCIKIKPEYVF